MKISSVVVFLLVDLCANTRAYLKLPSYIKKCSFKDPQLDECSKRHGNEAIPRLVKGDPMYKIPVLDPLVVKEIRVEDTSRSTTTSLSIVIYNMNIRGLANSKLNSRSHDFNKRSIVTNFIAPKLDVNAEYEMTGKLLSFPITGHGKCELTIDNLRINYIIDYDLIQRKDGKRYYDTKDTHLAYNITGGHIYLTDLFNGDKTLGDGMNQFLNENFLEVFEQVGPSIAESMNELFKQLNGNIYNLIPFDEFYNDLPPA